MARTKQTARKSTSTDQVIHRYDDPRDVPEPNRKENELFAESRELQRRLDVVTSFEQLYGTEEEFKILEELIQATRAGRDIESSAELQEKIDECKAKFDLSVDPCEFQALFAQSQAMQMREDVVQVFEQLFGSEEEFKIVEELIRKTRAKQEYESGASLRLRLMQCNSKFHMAKPEKRPRPRSRSRSPERSDDLRSRSRSPKVFSSL